MTGDATTTDGVRVEKAFDTDEFPVPAVRFDVENTRDEPVRVTITDDVPTSFEMDRVGFHPEYGSQHWTAYPDQRVVYERDLDAGESVTTVYGVRLGEDEDPAQFEGTPVVEVAETGVGAAPAAGDDGSAEAMAETTMSDIAPPERTDVVREVIEGERDSVPGIEDEADADAAADDPLGGDVLGDDVPAEDGAADDPLAGDPLADDATDPLADDATDPLAGGADDGDGADDAGDGILEDAPEEDAPEESADEEPIPLGGPTETGDEDERDADDAAESEDGDATTADDEGDEAATTTADAGDADGAAPTGQAADAVAETDERTSSPAATAVDGESSLVAALAAEVERGEADDEDLAALREAVGGPARSTETRIGHLQARVSDLEAYGDALEVFIDEHGTGDEVIDRVESDLDEVQATQASLVDDVEDLHGDVADVEGLLADVDETVETLSDRVEEFDDHLAAVETRLSDLEDGAAVEDLEDELEDVRGDLEAELDEMQSDLDELVQWRSQLKNVF